MKIAISLPRELWEHLEADRSAGRIESISGHISGLLRRERAAADVEATLQHLFGTSRPENEHRAWAREALGLYDDAGMPGD